MFCHMTPQIIYLSFKLVFVSVMQISVFLYRLHPTKDDLNMKNMHLWVWHVQTGSLVYLKQNYGGYELFWGNASCFEFLTGQRRLTKPELNSQRGSVSTLIWVLTCFVCLCIVFWYLFKATTSHLFVRLPLSSREEDVSENDDRQLTGQQTCIRAHKRTQYDLLIRQQWLISSDRPDNRQIWKTLERWWETEIDCDEEMMKSRRYKEIHPERVCLQQKLGTGRFLGLELAKTQNKQTNQSNKLLYFVMANIKVLVLCPNPATVP